MHSHALRRPRFLAAQCLRRLKPALPCRDDAGDQANGARPFASAAACADTRRAQSLLPMRAPLHHNRPREFEVVLGCCLTTLFTGVRHDCTGPPRGLRHRGAAAAATTPLPAARPEVGVAARHPNEAVRRRAHAQRATVHPSPALAFAAWPRSRCGPRRCRCRGVRCRLGAGRHDGFGVT